MKKVLKICLSILIWVGFAAGERIAAGQSRSGLGAVGASEFRSEPLALAFLETAEELAAASRPSDAALEQAMVLVVAARWLDYSEPRLQRVLLDLAAHWPERDYSPYVRDWLERYYREAVDPTLLQRSLAYLLGRMEFKHQQEQLLTSLAQGGQGTRGRFASDLRTRLGLIALEQSNTAAALTYFRDAYHADKYNKLAFGHMATLDPNAVGPKLYLEHLRYLLRVAPLDLDAALTFAQYAERLEVYSIAAGSYEYCVQLHQYLHPQEPVPPHIYLPWAMSCFNAPQKHAKVLDIAESIRRKGTFDIFLEAVAGRAALALGDPHKASVIFSKVTQQAEALQEEGPDAGGQTPERQQSPGPKQLAWFYCFANPDKDLALDWANRAYSVEPDSLPAASLLAFALAMNDQLQWARPLAEGNQSQIGLIAYAQILLSEGKVQDAKEALWAGIAKDPGSLAAAYAKDILSERGLPYTPSIDSAAILTRLADQFGEHIVPHFVDPSHQLSLRLDLPRSLVNFGEAIFATVIATNHSTEPQVMHEQGLFSGDVRVDAQLSGDLSLPLPGLIKKRIFTDVLVPPGQSVRAPARLDVPQLRRHLCAYAQASLDLEFTIAWEGGDSQPEEGNLMHLQVGPRALPVSVHRPGVQISSRTIDDLYNAIPMGDSKRRLETAKLFIGLLNEQELMYRLQQTGRDVLYPFKYADWMPAKLRSALTSQSGLLLHNVEANWETIALIQNELSGLTLPSDLVQTVSTHLNSPNWPLRLSTLVLLAQDPRHNIEAVLQWTAKHDEHVLVRDMARALLMSR